jgi:hypothetical protein
LLFEFPVVSNIKAGGIGHPSVSFSITVIVAGPNPGTNPAEKPSQWSDSTDMRGAGSDTIQIPVSVNWSESVVSFQIALSEEICYPGNKKDGEPNCYYAEGQFTGPDLSSISLGLSWPNMLANDAFLLLNTPAAAFQLSIIPTTILYGPLGNGTKAQSSLTITNITGTNQQFTNSQDKIQGLVNDDKTQWQGGATLSLGVNREAGVVCGKGTKCQIGLGFSVSEAWDHSEETDNQETYGTLGSVITEDQVSVQYTIVPVKNQPPLDQITFTTQPFWRDVILAVTNPQYAVWDYPQGPVIQPLASASVVALPILQLDHCANSSHSIEPTALPPAVWRPNWAFPAQTVIVDSNNNVQVMAGIGGLTGASPPNWNTVQGGATVDGSVTWTNEQTQFAFYRGSSSVTSALYLWLKPWKAGQAYPAGAIILGPDSIQVATTGGTSGVIPPSWNTADEATTTDGTVTWTNEQDHFVVYAGPVKQGQSVYQWLTSDNCKDFLSLDQFYVTKAQSASPVAYRILGNNLSLAPPSNVYTYSNQDKTVSSIGQNSASKATTKITDVASNSLAWSGGVDKATKPALVNCAGERSSQAQNAVGERPMRAR